MWGVYRWVWRISMLSKMVSSKATLRAAITRVLLTSYICSPFAATRLFVIYVIVLAVDVTNEYRTRSKTPICHYCAAVVVVVLIRTVVSTMFSNCDAWIGWWNKVHALQATHTHYLYTVNRFDIDKAVLCTCKINTLCACGVRFLFHFIIVAEHNLYNCFCLVTAFRV